MSAIGIGVGVALLAGIVSCAPNTSVAPFVELRRVERADTGFAISLPDDWEYRDAIEADPESWWEGAEVGNVSEYHDQVLADGAVLLARRAIGRENCVLSDFTAGAAEPPAWTAVTDASTEVRFLEADPGVLQAEESLLDLPAGPVMRIDTLWDDSWATSTFYFKERARWFRLDCGAKITLDWQTIAETFEFLSAEEWVAGEDRYKFDQA